MSVIELGFVGKLEQALASSNNLIQVVLGPRQVGKTTGIRQLLGRYPENHTYASADGMLAKSTEWLYEKWTLAQSEGIKLFVLDEIQKVENWSETVKQLWDGRRTEDQMKVVLLGSSSLKIKRGLSESLAGRYMVHRVHHWSASESAEGYGLSLEEYLLYGGYPGSYPLRSSPGEWLGYMRESIIDAVIGKDILTGARVKSPALFRQCFDIICAYPAQEMSYTKLLGQLQDKGNTDLVKHYLELFEGAFLIRQLFKYSGKKVLQRSSSPKLLPLCPALYSVGLDAELDADERGRCFELAVGAALCRLPGRLYYWRNRNAEVDYIYEFKKNLIAIEVKSGRKKTSKGLLEFRSAFPGSRAVIITPKNLSELGNLLG